MDTVWTFLLNNAPFAKLHNNQGSTVSLITDFFKSNNRQNKQIIFMIV